MAVNYDNCLSLEKKHKYSFIQNVHTARHTLFIMSKKNENKQLILQKKRDNSFIQNMNRVW